MAPFLPEFADGPVLGGGWRAPVSASVNRPGSHAHNVGHPVDTAHGERCGFDRPQEHQSRLKRRDNVATNRLESDTGSVAVGSGGTGCGTAAFGRKSLSTLAPDWGIRNITLTGGVR